MDVAENLTKTPPYFMIFPILGAACVILASTLQIVRNHKRGVRVGMGTYVLPVLIVAMLAFLATWCAMGLVDATDVTWIQAVVTLALAGSLLPLRDVVQARLDQFATKSMPHDVLAVFIRFLRDATIICTAAVFARHALEISYNEATSELTGQSVVVEYAVVALAMAVTFFAGQRTSVGPVIVTFACLLTGIAQSFIMRFKDAAILPSDLLALQTANEVADQYTYVLTDANVQGIFYAALALLVLCFLRPISLLDKDRIIPAVLVNLILALPLALALDWWIEVPDYRKDFGFTMYYWRTAETYTDQGFIPSFMTAVQDLPIPVPEGYSVERAQELIARYSKQTDDAPDRAEVYDAAKAQFDEMRPSIVVVMNETFADLSVFEGLHCDYEGPAFFNGLDDALSRGNLGVSVYGGGTCNSEFELLTGNSLAFLGSGKYPYQMYDFTQVDNLARQLDAYGYQTTAIHPNLKSNWNRNKVYSEMGFHTFLGIDDFPQDAPRLHNGVTDAATYQQILDILAKSDEPQFVMDVTMQNHGGYEETNIPDDRMTNYDPDGFSDNQDHLLNVYLSCIQASDEDLEWFVGQLRELERPVVLVFFGDHHPHISSLFNDRFFVDEDEVTHRERVYQTSYLVWANYDVEGNEQVSQTEDIGCDGLAALALDLVGGPLSDYQKAQLSMHKRLNVINAFGYLGVDGNWHAPGAYPSLDAFYRDMAVMDFLNFGSKFS